MNMKKNLSYFIINIITIDRRAHLCAFVYDITKDFNINPKVVFTHWQIDKTDQPYQYKPSEYRWHEPNTQNFCN